MILTDAIIGGIIALASSLLTLFVSNNLEIKKGQKELANATQNTLLRVIYSPLIFIINKNRDFFAKVMALKLSTNKVKFNNLEENEKKGIKTFLTYIFTDYDYSKDLKDLLFNKIYMIENSDLYLDIFLYTSYLGTIHEYLIMASNMRFNKINEIVEEILPSIKMMDEISSNLYKYSLAKTSRIDDYTYVVYFTEDNINKMDKILDEVNMTIFNTPVMDWKNIMDSI